MPQGAAAARYATPAGEIASLIDNIGMPLGGINILYMNSAPIGSADADIQVSLAPRHRPTARYIHDLRPALTRQFPGVQFTFVPSDMVTQILNFGLPAPIDIQVIGRNLAANRLFASRRQGRRARGAGPVDLRGGTALAL